MRRPWVVIVAATTLAVWWQSARGASPDLAALRSTTQDFLTAWYVKQDYGSLMNFIARDNEFAERGVRSQFHMAESQSPWKAVFEAAFPAHSARLSSLKEAISSGPVGAGSETLKPLNASSGRVVDPFVIVNPESAPQGSLFPRADATPAQREGFDAVAKYLDHLQHAYKGKLYVVMYATKGPQVLEEGVVLYWIAEGADWKLAMLQGTD